MDKPAECVCVPEDAAPRRFVPGQAAASVAIFGAFYVWTWLGIGTHLLHHYQSPTFLVATRYFRGCVAAPGGPADCVSSFLSQGFYFPWVGALVLTAAAWLVCRSTRALLEAFAARRVAPWLAYAPALLLVMLDGRYDYRLLPTVALLGALALTNLYIRLRVRAPARAAAFVVLYVLLYYLAGGIATLFAVLCGIFELARRRQLALGLAFLVLSPVLPLAVAGWSYALDLPEAFVNLHPYRSAYSNARPGPDAAPTLLKELLRTLSWLHASLMLFFPLAALAARYAESLVRAATRCREWTRRGLPWNALVFASMALCLYVPGVWWSSFILPAHICVFFCALFLLLAGLDLWMHADPSPAQRVSAALSVFLLLGAFLTWATFDVGVKRRIAVDYYASRRDWASVLETARRIESGSYDVYVMHEVNRALYHTGRLPYDMCGYPQFGRPPGILLSAEEMTDIGYTKFAEWSFELGNLNFARHWGNLALEIHGHSPRLLVLLSRVEAMLGRPEAARALLNSLARDPLYAGDARRRLRELAADPLLAADPECRQVRAVMLDRDCGYGGFGGFAYEEMLLQYAVASPRNREAFEYLMAYYLLTRQRAKLCANMGRLDEFDYVGIPRLYEEALLLEASISPKTPVTLRNRSISAQTEQRFREFLRDLDPCQNGPVPDRPKALETLIRRWGDSYFFFTVFGFTEPRPGWKVVGPPPPPKGGAK